MHVKHVVVNMNIFDKILIEKAKIHMVQFELGKFKRDFPSLYHTIMACMSEVKTSK